MSLSKTGEGNEDNSSDPHNGNLTMPTMLIVFLAILITGTPASVAGGVIGWALMTGLYKWYETESEHAEVGTPWQYRPTLWAFLFIALIGIGIYQEFA